MSKRGKSFNLQQHQEAGDKLQDVCNQLTALLADVSRGYGKTSKVGKQAQKTLDAAVSLQCLLEDLLSQENPDKHPREISGVYYGPRRDRISDLALLGLMNEPDVQRALDNAGAGPNRLTLLLVHLAEQGPKVKVLDAPGGFLPVKAVINQFGAGYKLAIGDVLLALTGKYQYLEGAVNGGPEWTVECRPTMKEWEEALGDVGDNLITGMAPEC